MTHLLTFDLGTTYFKACLFDAAGRMAALARAPTPAMEPRPSWREMDPGDFVRTIISLTRQLRSSAPGAWGSIERVCFATQSNSFLLLDNSGQPVTPIILWNDRRVERVDERLEPFAAGDELRRDTGVPSLNAQFAVAKLLWLQRHEPDAWRGVREARQLCLIGDYLALWLTGRHVTEAGAAGLTGLLNIHTLKWRRAMLRSLGLADLQLPEPLYAGSDLGELRAEARQQLDLRPGCRVVLGCLDQYAGAIGAGNVSAGGISETTGTVLATVALSEGFSTDLPPEVFQGPAWRPGLYWRMSFGDVSANLLESLRHEQTPAPSYDLLNAEAEAAGSGAAGLTLDSAASTEARRPIFTGLTPRHTRGHRVRAIMEGVAVALRHQVDTIAPGRRPPRILCTGGAARSRLWLQIKADTIGSAVAAVNCEEPASLGAAMLAQAAASSRPLPEIAATAPLLPPITPRGTGG